MSGNQTHRAFSDTHQSQAPNIWQLTVHVTAAPESSSVALAPGCCLRQLWIAPGHNSPRFKNGSKSALSRLDVLGAPQLLLHLAAIYSVCTGLNGPRFKNGSKRPSVMCGCSAAFALGCLCTSLHDPTSQPRPRGHAKKCPASGGHFATRPCAK